MNSFMLTCGELAMGFCGAVALWESSAYKRVGNSHLALKAEALGILWFILAAVIDMGFYVEKLANAIK